MKHLEQASLIFELDDYTYWGVNGYNRRYTHIEVSFNRSELTSVILHSIGTRYTVPFNQLTKGLQEYVIEATSLLYPHKVAR